MQNNILKESRRHGDIFLPISNYKMDIHNSKAIFDCHWHDELELFKVIKGKFRFQIASQFFDVCEGDLLFINSGELHSAMAEQNGNYIFHAVVFSPGILEGPANDKIQIKYLSPLLKGILSVKRHFQHTTLHEQNIQKYFDQVYSLLEIKPTAYEITLKAYLFLFFGELMQTASSSIMHEDRKRNEASAELIKMIIEYIQDNYQTNITIDILAKRCNISPGHFCRIFKKYTMKTPIEYLNYFRISKAARMLEATDQKILNIALDCGFNSLSYFINVFHESMACTPSEFRRKSGTNFFSNNNIS